MYLKLLWFLCVLFIIARCTSGQSNECTLPLPKLSFFAPLVFTNNGILKSTEFNTNNENVIRIASGEKVILSCSPNFFKKMPTNQFTEATCKYDQTLEINGEDYKFRKYLECEVRAIEEIITPIYGCGIDLTSVEYGFTNPINNKSYVIGEACYDEELGKTVFAHTTFKVDYKNYDLDKVALRIKNENHFKQEHPLSRFKLDFLAAARLDTLNDRLGQIYGPSNIPHLLQDRLIGTDLLVNYQFYNVMKLGWNYLMLNGAEVAENLLNIISDFKQKLKFDGSVDIYIGTHGVVSLPSKTGSKVDVYMTENKFPIAKYIWIVLKTGNKAVAFVVPNEPVNSEEEQLDELCPNKCSEGIHCCDYNDFKKKVPEMPALEGTIQMLELSN